MKDSRFAGYLSAYEERIKKECGMDVQNRLTVCMLLRASVNTTVTFHVEQVEFIYETIKMLACHGDGSTAPHRMEVVRLANFINNCRG